jgi:hypothetical protein
LAKNHKIFVHRNSENIHMKLSGDFDGSLASELLNLLKKNCDTASKIFIHTGCLRAVHSFGQAVFHKNLNFINNESTSLIIYRKICFATDTRKQRLIGYYILLILMLSYMKSRKYNDATTINK